MKALYKKIRQTINSGIVMFTIYAIATALFANLLILPERANYKPAIWFSVAFDLIALFFAVTAIKWLIESIQHNREYLWK